MNTGQMILTIGAVMLFSFIVLSFGDLQLNFTSVSLANESIIAGTGICQSIIDEISTKSFDEATVSASVSVNESLTSPNSLGPDAGETNYLLYDDVDDYNNHERIVSSSRLGDFSVEVSVYYVTFNAPETKILTTSFVKMVNVEVTTDLLDGNITQTFVVSY